ncbi:hypothetical protein PV327_004177 [Microctonus hyperodae]|uniref:Uncharacterized protein n=1 Tax=Microctonus hyperodae TaxID=165561 RepID=A0AA39FBX2_MICHY|nr:hypothetical protein PV327_004177 [Microctonus hyperodae]
MAKPSLTANDELRNSYFKHKSADEIETNDKITTANEENIRIVSVGKFTVEKITSDETNFQEVFIKTEGTKKLLESTKKYSTRSEIKKPWAWRSENNREDILKFRKNKEKSNGSIEKNNNSFTTKSASKLPLWKADKIKNIDKLNDKKIKLIKFADNSSNVDCRKSDQITSDISKICKVPPTISPEPYKNIEKDNKDSFIEQQHVTVGKKKILFINNNEPEKKCHDAASISAHARLEKSQAKIKRLQCNLVKINAETAESYVQKLPVQHQHVLKTSTISNLDLNKNFTKITPNNEFLNKHDFDSTSKTEQTEASDTDIDYISDAEKVILNKAQKPKYSKEVSEIEKRWSGEFLENQFGRNSSESSKSSYVEEIDSISSHGSVIEQSQSRTHNNQCELKQEGNNQEYQKRTFDEILEDAVSTIGSISYLDDQRKIPDEYLEDDGSKDSTLKQSSFTNSCLQIDVSETIHGDNNSSDDKWFGTAEYEKIIIPSEESDDEEEPEVSKIISDSEPNFSNEERQYTELQKVIVTEGAFKGEVKCDGYAELIKGITMEPGSSKGKDEKKKKGGLRRLLPGLFSPKDSRKEYKKEHKEKKKRDERHFNQHQQNGIYMRSPDTMHLNEDIKRNVNLNTSLNGTIIEERLNEIKQELFPDQGMTTSTPDHFLQSDRDHILGRRTPRLYTANSSLSSIAVEDKWIDQNIISGSPDMRKFKQQVKNDNDRKCNLERKHSLQESQPHFVRNHGSTGRISAPPSERYLIRPRAVHPVDRPLPAIPQKIEFSNYQNHEEIRKQSGVFIRGDRINYQPETYFSGNQNYTNEREVYGNGNHVEKTEINRNQSIDSGFNMTPVSKQLKANRQIINNQNGPKITCGIARSPKYSPSSSQKSGDYADSSYTPNSSQKSEFSPGSSKSGEYYLNSPRNSCRISPDYSINDRRDQPDHESTKSSTSYQIPSNIRVQIKDDRIYNEPPKSPFEQDKSSMSPRHLHHNTSQDPVSVQRGSPIIPLSSNLAKLRANVGTSSPSVDSVENSGERVKSPSIPSPVGTTGTYMSLIQSSNHRDITKSPLSNSPITISPQRQRFTSPLTIITPASPVASNNTLSPNGPSRSMSGTPSSSGPISPARILMHGRETPCRTPISSPTMSQMQMSRYPHMSTFQPRKAQPTDQILIASPKREPIYDLQLQRSSSRMESGCPDSPVPMVDSPSHSNSPRLNFHKTIAVRVSKTKSPDTLETSEQLPPEAFRDELPKVLNSNRSLSPPSSDKSIQKLEPIYVERQNLPRKALPEKVNIERQDISSTDTTTNMLLIPAKQENIGKVIATSPTKEQINENTQQPIHVQDYSQHFASPRSMSPDVRKETHASPKDRPDKLLLRKKDGGNVHDRPQGIYGNQKFVIQDRNMSTEDIYGKRLQQSPGPNPMRSPVNQYQQRHEVIVQQRSSTPSQEQQWQPQIYMSKQEALSQNREQSHSKQSKEPIYVQRNQKPAISQRIVEPIYSSNSNKQSSPSKRQTMQHLEAFYWQQKALESQKMTQNSPNTSTKSEEPDSPEVREAIYWHQLKKLDEEQQRKLFERNQFDERNDPTYWKKKIHNSSPSPTIDLIKHGSSASLSNPKHSQMQDLREQRLENPQQIYWRTQMQSTINPSAKPPLSGQKGQNQPVLVVRPQQANRELSQSQLNQKPNSKELRSKSVSPHFVRNDERRSLQLPRKLVMNVDDGCSEKHHIILNTRKSMTPPIYDDADIDKKQPPPIFKRGSLISNSSSSVEYGTMGTKRVSFSNQSNSPEIGSGNWPTKHGMAPEPPTRKHRSEEEIPTDTNDQNTAHLHEEDQNSINNIYGNTVACPSQQFIIYETYDANKPLPPPPSSDSWMIKRSDNVRDDKSERLKVQRANVPASPRKSVVGISESESGSEAGEVQKILQRRNDIKK